MGKDVLITPAAGKIEWSGTTSGVTASIYEVDGDLHIDSVNDTIIMGDGTPMNIEIGDVGYPVSFNFMGGGNLSSNGNSLDFGLPGDTINLNVTGVNYIFPDNLLTSIDYNASDVLNKLKTVDGSGSGLDADLLDGLHSSSLVQTSRTITINNTVQDLSANRTWNVGTITGITVTAGTGLTGGGTVSSTSGPTNLNITVGHADIAGSGGNLNVVGSGGQNVQGITLGVGPLGHVTGSSATLVNFDTRYITTGKTATVTSGAGLTGGGSFTNGSGSITVSHADTSSAGSILSDNSNGVVIQDINFGLDTYGHVTSASLGTVDLDTRYFTETESINKFLQITGGTVNGNLVVTGNTSVQGQIDTKYLYIQSSLDCDGSVTYNGSSFEVYNPANFYTSLNASSISATTLNISNQIISTVTGVTPMVVASTTLVSNLNADMLDGLHSSSFLQSSRNLTINGTSQNLSADRTWNVGTITGITVTAGTGLTGGGSISSTSGPTNLNITIGHVDVSAAASISSNNSNGVVLQDLTIGVSPLGHVTGASVGTVDLDTRYLTTSKTITIVAGTGMTGGGSVSLNGGSITIGHADIAGSGGNLNVTGSNGQNIQSITLGVGPLGHVTGSSATLVNFDTRYITTGKTSTVTAGAGLTGGGSFTNGSGSITVSHADTSSAGSILSDNSNGVVIQDINFGLDTYGHVTSASVGTVDLDTRYFTETESIGKFLQVTGGTINGNLKINNDLTVGGDIILTDVSNYINSNGPLTINRNDSTGHTLSYITLEDNEIFMYHESQIGIYAPIVELEGQLKSILATGTAPLVVASTTVVPNLNADMLDGLHSSSFLQSSRNLTINGTSQNLSADRTWNVGTITGITVSAGAGLSGGGTISSTTGPISGSFTISHSDTSSASNISSDNSNGVVIQDITVGLDTYGHVTSTSVGTVDLDTRYSGTGHTHTFSGLTSKPTTISGYGITDALSTSRTITINNTTQDLSANRTWNVGTITGITVTAGTGLTGGGSISSTSGPTNLNITIGHVDIAGSGGNLNVVGTGGQNVQGITLGVGPLGHVTGSSATLVNFDTRYITTGKTSTVTAGSGLSGGGSFTDGSGSITVSHADTSSAGSVLSDNSNGVVIQDINFGLDTYGHVTSASLGTVDLDTRYIRGSSTITVTAGAGLTGGGTMYATGGTVTLSHSDTSSASNISSSNFYGVAIQSITVGLDTYGHVTSTSVGTIDFDTRYFTESESISKFLQITGGTITGNLQISGNTSVGGTGTFAGGGFNSKRELKNIHDDWSGSAINEISNFKIRDFNYKNQPNINRTLGLIIDEIPDTISDYLIMGENHDSINLYSMHALSFKAHQEEINEINELKNEIKELKNIINNKYGLEWIN